MLGPHLGQDCLGLDERPSRLNEVINNDNVTAGRISLFNPDDALGPVADLVMVRRSDV